MIANFYYFTETSIISMMFLNVHHETLVCFLSFPSFLVSTLHIIFGGIELLRRITPAHKEQEDMELRKWEKVLE